MEYRRVYLKRLYNNIASVRDYIWRDTLSKNEGIIFECNGATLKIEPKDVSKGQVNKEEFTSKFDGRKYKLVDFVWK